MSSINNYDFIRKKLHEDDFLIFCDSGLKHLDSLQAAPDLIVGDFDSHENPQLGIETIVLPCEKDDTDTVFAVKEAIKRGYEEFLLIGVVGARLRLRHCHPAQPLQGVGSDAARAFPQLPRRAHLCP